MGARGTLGRLIDRTAGKSSDRVAAVAAHAASRCDQRDAVELALRRTVSRLDRLQRGAEKMSCALYPGAAYRHHGDDFPLELRQLRGEISGTCDAILQLQEIIWRRILRDDLGGDVLDPDPRPAPDTKSVAAFMALAQQNPCRGPERPEHVLLGADGPAHHHDHADSVVHDFFEHLLRQSAGVATLPDDAQELGSLRL